MTEDYRASASGAAAGAVLALPRFAVPTFALGPMRAFSLLRFAGAVLLSGCSAAPSVEPPTPVPADGRAVLARMHDRYAGKWYNTLTFTQKTSRLAADGKWNVQTWYEAMRVPGQLRIDFDPISAGNGVLYTRDSAFAVTNGSGRTAAGL